MPDDLQEKMAGEVYAILSAWMLHCLGQCWAYPTGGMVLPKEAVEAWRLQIALPYASAPEEAKGPIRNFAQQLIRVFDRG